MNARPLLILCAGGMGVAAAEALAATGRTAVFLDDLAPKGSRIRGFPVLGPLSLLPKLLHAFPRICVAHGDPAFRESLLVQAGSLGFSAPPIIHPSALLSPFCALGSGCVVLAGTFVGPLALVGRGCIVNTGAIVEHHCRVGRFSHICPGGVLLGRAVVEENGTIGAGAIVLPGMRVESGATVGAGAVVTKNVEKNTTVAGVPAKKLH